MNKKLTSIPDRAKLSSKLDEVIDSYVKYEAINQEGESDQDEDNIRVQVRYNILDRNLGEMVTSSVKALFLGQD